MSDKSSRPSRPVSPAPSAEGVEVQALAVAVRILDVLAQARAPVSAAEIARNLQMTPPRVWRHLKSMQALGLVASHPLERGFVPGWKLVQLGHSAVDRSSITEVAHPHAAELRDALGESVYVTVPYQSGTSVVISLYGTARISLHLSVGTFFEAHASASGRVAMAFSTPERIRRFLASHLSSNTSPDPMTDHDQLEQRLALIRQRHFDTAENQQSGRTSGTVYINAIAAPVFNHRDEIAGTIGMLTGISDEASLTSDTMLQPLFRSAARISAALGSSYWERAGVISPRE